MPTRSFFYSSVANDRIYDADSWALLLRGLYANGVFLTTGTELQVSPTNPATLGVLVAVGSGLTDGRYSEVYDAALSLTITTANPTNPRIDTVVLRRNLDPAVRASQVVVKAGTAAASPVAPTLQQDATIWEEPLANVAVAAGATSIVAANITDRRAAAGARNAAAVGGRVPGAATGNLPILDSNGRVPDATALQGRVPGTASGNIALLDATGRVPDASALRGSVPGTAAGNIAILDASGRVPSAANVAGAVPGSGFGNLPILGGGGRLALASAASVPRVSVWNSGVMTVADGSTVALYFNNWDFIVDNMFDPAVSNYSITIRTAGHYLIGANGSWSDANAEGERNMAIWQNANYQAAMTNFFWAGSMAANRGGRHTLAILRPCNVGDTFQVRAYQKSAGSLSMSDYHLYAFWVGP